MKVCEFCLQFREDGACFLGLTLPKSMTCREFDPAAIKNADGRGLANMQARAMLIDAEIAWAKRDGGGTLFTLQRSENKAK